MKKIVVIGMVGQSVFLPVDNFHKGGETIKAHSLKIEAGGKGCNQAVCASRFGCHVTFIGAIGNDGYKKEVEKLFNKEKVVSVLIEKDFPSAYACIITDKNGSNHVTEYLGAELDKKDIENNRDIIAKCDILLLNNEVPQEVNIKAVEIAVENGVKIIMNPAPQRNLPQIIKDNVYLFTPNEHEVQGLEDKNNVIITMGNKGSYIKELNKQIPATKDIPIDTTGAGDVFNGALVAMLAQGKNIEESVIIATKASGKSITKRGAVSSIPYKEEII